MSKKEDISTETMLEAGRAVKVQRYQLERAQEQVEENKAAMRYLSANNDENNLQLDVLLEETGKILDDDDENIPEVDEEYIVHLANLLQETEQESVPTVELHLTDTVNYKKEFTWEEYATNIETYGFQHHIDLDGDVYLSLLTPSEQQVFRAQIEKDYRIREPQLDLYDYMVSAFCGIAAGLIDAFFVKAPKEGKLGMWTDKKADDFVMKISQMFWDYDEPTRAHIKSLGLSGQEEDELLRQAGIPTQNKTKGRVETLHHCIQYLEYKFKVNYEATTVKRLENGELLLGDIGTNNHHIKSLAHCPDIVGLIFSVIDQFTGEGSYIMREVNGGKHHIVRRKTVDKNGIVKEFELRGNTLTEKIVCAVINWLCHLCSDYVGSNTARTEGSNGRGSGLGIPFYEFLLFCDFGKIKLNDAVEIAKKEKLELTISEMSLKVFEQGYDLRFGEALAMPVALNESMVRIFYALKHQASPFQETPELSRMLLVAHGAFCTVDTASAYVEGKGNPLIMATNLNIIGWARLAFAVMADMRNKFLEGDIDREKLREHLQSEWNQLNLTTAMI